jgi:hypothetical protein
MRGPHVDIGEPTYGPQSSTSEHRINVTYDMPNEFKKRQVTRRDARASAQLHAKERAVASSADLGPVT